MSQDSGQEMDVDTNPHLVAKEEPIEGGIDQLQVDEKFNDDDYDDGYDEEEDGDDQLVEDNLISSSSGLWNISEKDRVQEQEVVSRNVKELYDMMRSGRLNFTPEYQRDEVWTKARKQGLLDSLFKGCPIPALVLAHKTPENGKPYYNVIDGKQRLTTILRFMSGKLGYKNKESTHNKEFFYKNVEGAAKASYVVPADDRKYFETREIVCVEHYNLPTWQEEDIFKRIQQGMTLVTGEKSSVGNSPRQQYIKQLMHEYLSPGSVIATNCNIDINRGRNFVNLASFVFICDHLPRERVSPTNTSRIKWLENPTDEVSEEVKARCKAALDEFVVLAEEYPDPFTRVTQRVAPVEFQFIAVYLYITHDSNIEMDVRAKELVQMRASTHAAFPNTVKSNSTVYKHLWNQLDAIAMRQENGYERLELLPDRPLLGRKTKAKGKAKAGPTVTMKDEDTETSVDDDLPHETPKKRGRLALADEGSSSPLKKATPRTKKVKT